MTIDKDTQERWNREDQKFCPTCKCVVRGKRLLVRVANLEKPTDSAQDVMSCPDRWHDV